MAHFLGGGGEGKGILSPTRSGLHWNEATLVKLQIRPKDGLHFAESITSLRRSCLEELDLSRKF